MEMDDLKDKYKGFPLAGRMAIWALVGLIPAGFAYVEEGEALEGTLQTAMADLETERKAFEDASKQKANLPKLEEEKHFTEEQLAKARKKLPDAFRVEEVLQKAATIAKETGVKLTSFRPLAEQTAEGEFKYKELPIETKLEGKFAQITAYLDRVVHLENSVFVKKIEVETKPGEDAQDGGDRREQKSEYQKALEARQNLKLAASFNMVVFRAMTDAELAAGGGDAPAGEDGDPRGKMAPPAGGEGGEGQAPAKEAPPAAEGG